MDGDGEALADAVGAIALGQEDVPGDMVWGIGLCRCALGAVDVDGKALCSGGTDDISGDQLQFKASTDFPIGLAGEFERERIKAEPAWEWPTIGASQGVVEGVLGAVADIEVSEAVGVECFNEDHIVGVVKVVE